MGALKRVLPPVYVLITLLVMVGLDFFLPVARIVARPYSYAGAVLIALGVAMNVWASGYFNKVKTPVKPFEQSTRLVTVGLYRYTRNPMYLGLLLILAGIAVLLGNLTPFLVIGVLAWLLQLEFIRVEEAALEATFGEDYAEYKKQVRRWI